MDNENLLDLMYCIAEAGASAARNQEPGDITWESYYGDEKRDIDQVAEDAIVDHFESEAMNYDFDAALKPEDAEWGEEWLTDRESELVNQVEDLDYALIVDQVEGTKNYENRDRYTTLAAIDPENPTLEGIESAVIYRWDHTAFLSDRENAYINFEPQAENPRQQVRNSTRFEARPLDSVGYETKIRGQMIGRNSHNYAEFMDRLIDLYNLKESEWPSLKADGTTTGDILGTVTDKSIAVDLRALKDRERLPFAQDFAPAAKIAKDAGSKVVNEKGDPVETDFTEPGVATTFIALPPGKASEDLEEDLPDIVEKLL